MINITTTDTIKIPPVQKGDILKVIPYTYGDKKDPIVKVAGYVIIIKGNCQLGESVKIQIDFCYPNFALASLTK